jgi:hypothetical protein
LIADFRGEFSFIWETSRPTRDEWRSFSTLGDSSPFPARILVGDGTPPARVAVHGEVRGNADQFSKDNRSPTCPAGSKSPSPHAVPITVSDSSMNPYSTFAA